MENSILNVNKFDKAVNILQEMLKGDAENSAIWFQLSWSYYGLDQIIYT
jgi:predicted Zn-dependent protease